LDLIGVGLAPSAACDRGPADPLLGFLGRSPFRRENPLSRGLDFLGFSWIPSSESKLFNGYADFFGKKISPSLPRREKPGALGLASLRKGLVMG
jgi:hypothetical protein